MNKRMMKNMKKKFVNNYEEMIEDMEQ